VFVLYLYRVNEQELLTLPEHLNSPGFSGVRVTRSFVLLSLFVLFLLAIVCLSFFDLRIMITSLVSSNSSYATCYYNFFQEYEPHWNRVNSDAPEEWAVPVQLSRYIVNIRYFHRTFLTMRGDCSFCWYCWNCWPSLLKLYFHNEKWRISFVVDNITCLVTAI
jgi:hypothetical protein